MSSETSEQTGDLLWVPRRQLTLAQARRRSDLVKLLRMAFTAGAAVSIGLLLGHLISSAIASGSGARKSFKSNEIVTMINPRFTGRDARGEAYVITADAAQRRRADENVVDLIMPNMVDELGSEVSAPEGTYDRREQTLDLFGDVRFTDATGYTFRSTQARFYVLEGRIEGIDPLRGEGPLGDIRCDTYEVSESGDVVTCRGNVDMTIYPADREPAIETGQQVEGDDG